MESGKPSFDLVRAITDEHVLRALMRHRRLTRAELAVTTGISKPTAGESVRRLTERGVIEDTGERTPGGRGRGRVGSYYALAADAGTALAASIAPEGVVAECVNAYGDVVSRAGRPAESAAVAAALRAAATECRAAAGAVPRLAVVSAADPVERATGRLVQLPDAPFLVGELDPVAVLAPEVDGPVTVDNDVNWAARAERAHAGPGLDDFAYVYLGEGLGCAVVSDGAVRRGHTGIAGEIAHVVTTGPDGRATAFIEVFGRLGLRRPASTAIDVQRLLDGDLAAVAEAVAGVLAAVVALADPGLIVLGGPWGGRPEVIDAIRAAFVRRRRHVPVRPTALAADAALAGARGHALDALRSAIVATPA